MDKAESKKDNQVQSSDDAVTEVSESRRKAVAKLAYASPLIASMLFSKQALARPEISMPPGNP